MKKLLIVLMMAALLLGSVAFADARPSTTLPPFGWVEGVVTDADTGAKLSGVTVKINGQTLTTDAQGKYSIQLDLGTYTVAFAKADYEEKTASVTMKAGKYATVNCAMAQVSGLVTGVVSDATNPSIKLAGVKVSADGKTATTDASGKYEIRLSPGQKTLAFSKDGYINTSAALNVARGRDNRQDVSMSPELASNEYRVVLTWGETPKDLDSHLKGVSPRGTSYHMYFHDKKPTGRSTEVQLDVDDTSSFGPETTTFVVDPRYNYVFYVLDYTNRKVVSNTKLQQSGAKIEVYCGNERVQVYSVPAGVGRYWEVFRIRNGVLTTVNTIVNTEPTN